MRPPRTAGAAGIMVGRRGYEPRAIVAFARKKHRDIAPMTRKPWHHAGSRHERGYGVEWERIRKAIIARDHGLCQPCLRNDRPAPFNAVDHIKPKSEGGTDDADNLECICTECHNTKTQEEAARAQGRTIKPRLQFTPDGQVIWP